MRSAVIALTSVALAMLGLEISNPTLILAGILGSLCAALVNRMWSLALLGAAAIAVISFLYGDSPYVTNENLQGPKLYAVCVTITVLFWIAGAGRFRQAPVVYVHSRFSGDAIFPALVVCQVVGAVATAYTYAFSGIPLFSSNPDAARASVALQNSGAIGLLREFGTVSTWFAVASCFGALSTRRRRSFVTLALAGLAVAALGASRNAVGLAAIPPVVACVVMRPASPSRAISRTTIYGWIAAGLGLAGLTYLSGYRIASGQGAYESELQTRSDGNVWSIGIQALESGFSAPLETLSRLIGAVNDGSVALGNGKYSTESIGFLYRPFTPTADLYDITGSLSQPYYMNVATYIGAPYADFGAAGAVVLAAMAGLGIGLYERKVLASGTLAGLLLYGYGIYLMFFTVYEAFPLIYATFLVDVPLTIALASFAKRASDLPSNVGVFI